MHDLVAQCVDPVEQNAQYGWGIAVGQCLLCGTPTAGKTFGPLLLADLAVLVFPEALEHEGVVEQCANAAGELGPDQVLDQVGRIEGAQLVQERLERRLLGKTVLLIDVGGVRGVEGNPQENETPIDILGLLGTAEPLSAR